MNDDIKKELLEESFILNENFFGFNMMDMVKNVSKKKKKKDPYKTGFFDKLSQAKASVKVDNYTKTISITGLNYNKLIIRIKELYKEKKFDNILGRTYSEKSLEQYRKRKIKKSDMKITELHFHIFFALEIAIMFDELYDYYKFPYYTRVASEIRKKTWIGRQEESDGSENPYKLNMGNIKRLKYKLLPYQQEFIENYNKIKYKNSLEGFILSFDQGLGKTLTSIALAEALYKKKIFIVCPNSLKFNWVNEIRQYYRKYEIEPTDLKEDICVVEDRKYSKSSNKTKFYIINQESINKVLPYCKEYGNDSMIIVDESHNFRNIDSKRTALLLSVKNKLKCKDVLMMSGTPIKATPNELIPSMLMIDPMFDIEAAKIYNKVFNLQGMETANIVQRRFGMIIYRKTKTEVLTLPEKNIETLILKVSNEEKYYIETAKEKVNELFKEKYDAKLANNDSLKVEYFRLVKKYSRASNEENEKYFKYLNDSINTGESFYYHELDLEFYESFFKVYVLPYIPDYELKRSKQLYTDYVMMRKQAMGEAIGAILPKLRTEMYVEMYKQNKKMIIDMINNCPKKTVIFSQMLGVVEEISKDLHESGIYNVAITGGTRDRFDLINEFKNDDKIEVLLATSQTLSAGVTLTEASQMFFFGTPWRQADLSQCQDRIYRIGQNVPVNIYITKLNSGKKNLSDRMDDILNWSSDMFDAMVEGSTKKKVSK